MDLEKIVGGWASKAKTSIYLGVIFAILWWNVSPVICDALAIQSTRCRAWIQLASGIFIIGGWLTALHKGTKKKSYFDY